MHACSKNNRNSLTGVKETGLDFNIRANKYMNVT